MDVFRWANCADAAAIHNLFFAAEPWQSFQTRFATWLHMQERGRIVYLLMERDRQLTGQGQLLFWPGARGEIANVAVAAACQNQGIGTAILSHLVQSAQAYACTTVEISVAHTNPRAQALYQRLGFSVARPLDSAYDESGVVMKMAIRSSQ